ncbi:MAG TPA: hypothetical protein P5137_00570 [Candidatus Brocadiia bacterium]|nr:hypothetical protein [Candidatus Brocadiia bacterium]
MRATLATLALAALLFGCRTPAQRAAEIMASPGATPLQRLRAQALLAARGGLSPENAFFPIGLYDVPLEALDQAAAAGFNTIVNGDKDNPAYLARCEALGLRLVPYVRLGAIEQDTSRAAGQRALWAWYLFDEPDINQWPADKIAAGFEALRKADPSRPIFLVVWAPPRYAEFMSSCDVFGVTPYPIVKLDARENDLRRVGCWLDAARRQADGRPVWAILQAFWAEPHWPRNPTAQEWRAMVYIAVNHGASGLVAFGYKSGDQPLPCHKPLWEAIARANAELAALRAAIVQPPIPAACAVRREDWAPFDDDPSVRRRSPLDCSLRRLPGARMLIAVNPDPWPKTASLDLGPTFAAPANDVELFADPSRGPVNLPANRRLELDFNPFEARLFLLPVLR